MAASVLNSGSMHASIPSILFMILALVLPVSAADGGPQADVPKDLDIYLLVGQSNMAGRGKPVEEDKKPVPGIYVLDKQDQWVLQGEPIHFDKGEAGVGPGFTFARKLLEKQPGRPIGLVPCAVGGTPQSRWMPGADLYENAVKRARIAQGHGTLKGILWHQGEAECGDEAKAKAYAANLAKIVEGFRKDLGAPNVPFIAGQLGEFLYTRKGGKSPFAKVVNEQIATLPTLVPNTAVVSSQGLGHKGDELHFNGGAAKEFGARYFEAYWGVRSR